MHSIQKIFAAAALCLIGNGSISVADYSRKKPGDQTDCAVAYADLGENRVSPYISNISLPPQALPELSSEAAKIFDPASIREAISPERNRKTFYGGASSPAIWDIRAQGKNYIVKKLQPTSKNYDEVEVSQLLHERGIMPEAHGFRFEGEEYVITRKLPGVTSSDIQNILAEKRPSKNGTAEILRILGYPANFAFRDRNHEVMIYRQFFLELKRFRPQIKEELEKIRHVARESRIGIFDFQVILDFDPERKNLSLKVLDAGHFTIENSRRRERMQRQHPYGLEEIENMIQILSLDSRP